MSSGTGAEDPSTQMTSGQGVQAGDHNSQHNYFLLDRRIDAEMLKTLNLHAAADQVRQMQSVDAARLLATASARVSAEVLRVLLSADAPLVITLLSRINRRKAEELVAEVIQEAPWLAHLPAAVEMIARCETGMRRVLGNRVKQLAREGPSSKGTQGYGESYDGGVILWSSPGGAQTIAGDILKYYVSLGGIKGQLGFPLTPETPAQRPPFGTTGSRQRFESFSDYGSAACERIGVTCGGTVYSSAHGVHATQGSVGEYYELEGGSGGWLGFPISDIELRLRSKGKSRKGIFRRKTEVDPSGSHDFSDDHYQRFEGGTIYCKSGSSPVAVRLQVDAYIRRRGLRGSPGFYRQEGETRSWLGFPISTPRRPYNGRQGRLAQTFEGGTIFWAITVPLLSLALV